MKHQESYQDHQYKSLPSIIVQERKFSAPEATLALPPYRLPPLWMVSICVGTGLFVNNLWWNNQFTLCLPYVVYITSIFCFHQVATGNTSGSDTTEYERTCFAWSLARRHWRDFWQRNVKSHRTKDFCDIIQYCTSTSASFFQRFFNFNVISISTHVQYAKIRKRLTFLFPFVLWALLSLASVDWIESY